MVQHQCIHLSVDKIKTTHHLSKVFSLILYKSFIKQLRCFFKGLMKLREYMSHLVEQNMNVFFLEEQNNIKKPSHFFPADKKLVFYMIRFADLS